MTRIPKPLTIDDIEKLLDRKLEPLRAEINLRFEQIDSRFTQIDKRFEQIDSRFTQIDKRFDQTDKRFEKIENQAKTNFSVLLEIIQYLRKEMNERFAKSDRDHEEMIEAIRNFVARSYESHDMRLSKLEHKILAT